MPSAFSFMMRDDTLLGACFAFGEDFGFDPLYPRALFAIGIFWSLPGAAAAYAGLFALVALSRLIAPHPAASEVAVEGAEECGDEPCEELPLAA